MLYHMNLEKRRTFELFFKLFKLKETYQNLRPLGSSSKILSLGANLVFKFFFAFGNAIENIAKFAFAVP